MIFDKVPDCISGQFCIDFYLSNTYFRKFLKENGLDMLLKGLSDSPTLIVALGLTKNMKNILAIK